MKLSVALLGLLWAGHCLAAPHVLLDTEAGPILLELDEVRAPRHVENFLAYVNGGFYDGLVFHRTINNFVVQAGAVTAAGISKAPTRPAISSERGNGLSNTPGTVALALSGNNVNSGQAQFFINAANNAHLNENFTVFGRVVYGSAAVTRIEEGATYDGQTPFRPVLIRQAVESEGFPLHDMHSGSWFDPAKAGRGVVLEIAADPENAGRRLLIAYWYDYIDGRQAWMNGATSFALGASTVTVPLQISQGGQFGDAYAPEQVSFDESWGELDISFADCGRGTFSYRSQLGNGSWQLQRITSPTGRSCEALVTP